MSRENIVKSIPTITVGQIPEILDLHYNLPSKRPVLLIGETKIGKTASVLDYAKKRKLKLIYFPIAGLDDTSIRGFPKVKDESDTVKLWLLDHIREAFYYEGTERDDGSKGILFLDELNRGEPETINAIFQLVTLRRIDTNKLKRGWLVVAAINPDTEDYTVNMLDAALLQRFSVINVVPSFSDWKEWAVENSVLPDIIMYLENNPDHFYIKMSDGNYITGESWAVTSQKLEYLLRQQQKLGKYTSIELAEYLEKKPYLFAMDIGETLVQDLVKYLVDSSLEPVIDLTTFTNRYLTEEEVIRMSESSPWLYMYTMLRITHYLKDIINKNKNLIRRLDFLNTVCSNLYATLCAAKTLTKYAAVKLYPQKIHPVIMTALITGAVVIDQQRHTIQFVVPPIVKEFRDQLNKEMDEVQDMTFEGGPEE